MNEWQRTDISLQRESFAERHHQCWLSGTVQTCVRTDPTFLVSSQKVGRLAWRKVHDTDRGPGTSKKADWDESLLK